MTFRNSILAGLTLIREAIRSQNYQAGVEGWSINADGTAEFADLTIRSSDGSGATAVVENGRVTLTAANGWKIILDPTNVLPIIYFRDATGDEMGAINASGIEDQAALVVSSGPFADGPYVDWKWVQIMGETDTGNRLTLQRLRDEDESFHQGGYVFLDPDTAQFAVSDSSDATQNTLLHLEDHVFVMDRGRALISPVAEASPALFVNVVVAGHTGNLLHLQREGSGKFTVDTDGNVTALGDVEAIGSVVADNLRAGQAITPAPGAGGGTSEIAVAFSSPMNAFPRVMLTARSAADPETTVIRGYADAVTTSGFTLRCYRSTDSTTIWSYVAIAE